MKEYKIAVIPGDGIGPEVVSGAVSVLEKVSEKYGFKLELDYLDAGGCSIDKYGVPLTEDTLQRAKNSDAVLLGAVGGPKWDSVDSSIRPERALLGLRAGLGLYANLRPAIMYPELSEASPLKDKSAIDLLIVRELTGGIYFGKRGRSESDDLLSDGSVKGKTAYDIEDYSEGEINRILKTAFELSMGRNKKLTLVDKSNVLESSRLWGECTEQMAKQYPQVEVDHLYVDNCAMQLVARPSTFDVIVTSNMFGDILSDEAGMITGSIGMLPSASLGKEGTPGMYEPVHGSAPDIAGSSKANPLATILSAAMLLRWSLHENEAADSIEAAVKAVISDGYRTPDIAYNSDGIIPVTTEKMTEAVLERLV